MCIKKNVQNVTVDSKGLIVDMSKTVDKPEHYLICRVQLFFVQQTELMTKYIVFYAYD